MNKLRGEEGTLSPVPVLMKDNRGFSLIELIVVMLIIAILAVGSIAGYNLLNAGSAKRAAERIISVLSSVQMDNMTKSRIYMMEIKQSAGKYILSVYYDNAGHRQDELNETLDLKDGSISFDNDEDFDNNSVTPSDILTVSFRKDTGGINAYNGAGESITRIRVTSSDSTCYIRLVTTTGKHFIE